MAGEPNDDDPNTARELSKARGEARERRIRIGELEELIEGYKGQITKLEKASLAQKTEFDAANTKLAEVEAALKTAKTEAEKTVAEKVAEVTAAKDSEIATLKSGFEANEVSTAIRLEAVKAGVRNPDDFAKLVDVSKITRDKDGKLVGVAELVAAEKTGERAYLFGEGTSTTKPGQKVPNPPDPKSLGPKKATEMTDGELAVGLREFGVKDLRLSA